MRKISIISETQDIVFVRSCVNVPVLRAGGIFIVNVFTIVVIFGAMSLNWPIPFKLLLAGLGIYFIHEFFFSVLSMSISEDTLTIILPLHTLRIAKEDFGEILVSSQRLLFRVKLFIIQSNSVYKFVVPVFRSNINDYYYDKMCNSITHFFQKNGWQ